MLIKIVDFLIVLVQAYMCANFVFKLFPMRWGRLRSKIMIIIQISLGYFLVNYFFSKTPWERIITATILFVIVGFFLFQGNPHKIIFCGIMEYSLFLLLDLAVGMTVYPWYMSMAHNLPVLDEQMLGRGLYNIVLFLVMVMFEAFQIKKTNLYVKEMKHILGCSIALGILQMVVFYLLLYVNPSGLHKNNIVVSILLSSIIIIGYLLIMEMFYKIIEQEEKEYLMEQTKKERAYQYEYYLKAYRYGEDIRNYKHELRNYLQTIYGLIETKNESDKVRAGKMVENIQKSFDKKRTSFDK